MSDKNKRFSDNEALQRALAKCDEQNKAESYNNNTNSDESLRLIKEISKKVNFLYVLAIISLVLSIISGIILPFMR